MWLQWGWHYRMWRKNRKMHLQGELRMHRNFIFVSLVTPGERTCLCCIHNDLQILHVPGIVSYMCFWYIKFRNKTTVRGCTFASMNKKWLIETILTIWTSFLFSGVQKTSLHFCETCMLIVFTTAIWWSYQPIMRMSSTKKKAEDK
jgi:hypothetical protein